MLLNRIAPSPVPAGVGFRLKPLQLIRNLHGLSPVLARAGTLELRLATTWKEIRQAQRLRFRIFFEEGQATPSAANAAARRDRCPFDGTADHLLVIDTEFASAAGRIKHKVVGNYRLIRSDMARAGRGFYSATSFQLAPLLERQAGQRLLELGRSCVDGRYRSRRVIELLWRGIAIYAAHHRIDALIGCASLPGVDTATLAVPLGFLRYHARAAPEWQVEAHPGLRADLDLAPPDTDAPRGAMTSLPPLIKAYLRVGGRFADDPARDAAFNCVDVFTALSLRSADARYMAHFGAVAASLS